jgi:hypothetical protein
VWPARFSGRVKDKDYEGPCITWAESYYRPKMKAKIALVLLSLSLAVLPAAAQQPVLDYTLTVNTNDRSFVVVAMRMRNLPDRFHLATVRHFLVDDRPWSYVGDLCI